MAFNCGIQFRSLTAYHHVVLQVSESMCSLQFATRVRAVELGASKKTQDSAEVATLKKRIAELEVS